MLRAILHTLEYSLIICIVQDTECDCAIFFSNLPEHEARSIEVKAKMRSMVINYRSFSTSLTASDCQHDRNRVDCVEMLYL